MEKHAGNWQVFWQFQLQHVPSSNSGVNPNLNELHPILTFEGYHKPYLLGPLGCFIIGFRTFTISGRGFFNVGIYVPWYICVCIYMVIDWDVRWLYAMKSPAWNRAAWLRADTCQAPWGWDSCKRDDLKNVTYRNPEKDRTSQNNHQFRLGFAKFNLLLGKAQFNGRFFSDFPTKARSFVASEIFSLVLSNNGGCKTWEIEALNHGMFGFSRHVQTDQSHCHNQDLHGTFDVAVIGYPLWRRPEIQRQAWQLVAVGWMGRIHSIIFRRIHTLINQLPKKAGYLK